VKAPCRKPSSGTDHAQASVLHHYRKTFKPKNQRIDSPVSAAQGYDSIYLLAAAINSQFHRRPKIKRHWKT
jgi:branched-chain amino acid transport system substrate-binding protein